MGFRKKGLRDQGFRGSSENNETLRQAQGDKKKWLKGIREFIRQNFLEVIYPDERISEKAIWLLEHYALSDGLRTVDALIAASAIAYKAALATANFKHFKNVAGLHIILFEP